MNNDNQLIDEYLSGRKNLAVPTEEHFDAVRRFVNRMLLAKRGYAFEANPNKWKVFDAGLQTLED